MSTRRWSLTLTGLALLAWSGPALAQDGEAAAAEAAAAPAAAADKAADAKAEGEKKAGEAKAEGEKAKAEGEKAKAEGEKKAEEAAAAGEAKVEEAAAAGEAKAEETKAAGEAKAEEAAAAGEAKAEEAAAAGEAKAEEAAADAKAMMVAPPADGEIGVPFPSLYLGVSGGGHFVLTDWDFAEFDDQRRPVSPESSMIGKLRIGFQAAEWLALEASLGHFAFKASTETNPGWLYEADALFFLANQDAWSGFVSAGLGLYHNAAPDIVDSEADINVHVGLGTKIRLADWVWLRGEARYYLADSLDPDLPFGSNVEATIGLDFMLWGPETGPKDTDGDGIFDPDDKCPEVAGEKSAAGCPDRDRDGIADAEDACPDAAGPAETKGCPDRDGDGILDKDDKCPDEKGVPEEQGCPAKAADSDGDGIVDEKDLCPQEPEDKDGIEDANGCPETDADKDGILDEADKCPLKPENINEFEDKDGCPDEKPQVVVTCERFELNDSVYFDTAKFTIQQRSFGLLDSVAKALQDNAFVKEVRVEGHTDSQGNAGRNQTLSSNRAKAVRDYLISKGVDAKRLTSKGYGQTRPIASNDTEQGRAQNRRVDFVITKQDEREGCK